MITGYEGMLDKAREARKKYDESMRIIEEQVIKATTVDMERLRPQIADKEAFDQLIAVVNEATQKNYSIAKLQEKISVLGTNVRDTAVEVGSINVLRNYRPYNLSCLSYPLIHRDNSSAVLFVSSQTIQTSSV
jgi:hypothetical protein